MFEKERVLEIFSINANSCKKNMKGHIQEA